MSEKYETPKRMTAHNDVTGALIKSKADNQDAYAEGWDRIFGKKPKATLYIGITGEVNHFTVPTEDVAFVESEELKARQRQDPPNDNWCVGCTPENCSTGCGKIAEADE